MRYDGQGFLKSLAYLGIGITASTDIARLYSQASLPKTANQTSSASATVALVNVYVTDGLAIKTP